MTDGLNQESRLAGLVEGLAVTPALPEGRSNRVGAEPDDASPSGERDPFSSWSTHICYTNAKGESSERLITCLRVEGYGRPETVFARCHATKKVKSFRIDRMTELYDLAGGGVSVDPVRHFDRMMLDGLLGMKDKAFDDFGRLLVFMARCDGDYHPLEEVALAHALGRYMLHYGGDDAAHERAVHSLNAVAPDGTDLVNSLTRIARCAQAKPLSRLILEATGSMIDADGRHASEEVEWALEVSHVLKSAAAN